jgi:hypothetical protein
MPGALGGNQDRPGLCVEVSRSEALLFVPYTRIFGTTEGHMVIRANCCGVHPHQPRLKAFDKPRRPIEVVSKACSDEPLADIVGDLNSLLRRSSLQERSDRGEDLFLGEGILRCSTSTSVGSR